MPTTAFIAMITCMAKRKTTKKPTPPKPPSPSDLTEEQLEGLAHAIKIGADEHDACWSVGLDPRLYRQWMKGTEEAERDFQLRMRKAEGGGVVEQLEKIYDGQDSAGTARWWTSKKRPASFGDKGAGVSVRAAFGAGRGALDPVEEGQAHQIESVLEAAGIEVSIDIGELVGRDDPE